MTPDDAAPHIKAYELKRPEYEAFTKVLVSLVGQLLKAKPLDFSALEGRAKEIASFSDKIQREDKDYSDPINQITDLAGLRIITYQLADLEPVCEIIETNLEIDRANSVDKREIIEVDRFGYASVHYVVSLGASRAALPEYKKFAGLRAEIQVRTVLQHAWAAIDHKLRYKTKEEIPAKLRRRLFRISALLELADDEFGSLTSQIADVKAAYSEAISGGSLNIPVDADSLNAYIEGNEHAKALLEACNFLDIVIHQPQSKLPEFSALLQFIDSAEIRTIEAFDSYIKGISRDAQETLAQLLQHWRNSGTRPSRLVVTKDSLFRMMLFLAFSPKEADRLRSKLRIGSAVGNAVDKLREERIAESRSGSASV